MRLKVVVPVKMSRNEDISKATTVRRLGFGNGSPLAQNSGADFPWRLKTETVTGPTEKVCGSTGGSGSTWNWEDPESVSRWRRGYTRSRTAAVGYC